MSNFVLERKSIYQWGRVTQVGNKLVTSDSILNVAEIGLQGGNWLGDFQGIDAGNDANWYQGASNRESMIKFTNITLPSDAIVLSALLKLQSQIPLMYGGLIESYVAIRVYGEKSSNAGIIARTLDPAVAYTNYISRARTTSYVDCDNITSWAESEVKEFNIAPIIQELINAYGGLTSATVMLFWGDIDGRTPVPSANKTNRTPTLFGSAGVITSRGAYESSNILYPLIRIEYSSESSIPPVPHPHTSHLISEHHIIDANYTIEDTKIINDVRVVIPEDRITYDYSTIPPTEIPVDFMARRIDQNSINLFGRRSKQINEVRGNYNLYSDTLCESEIALYKDPKPELDLTLQHGSVEFITKSLLMILSDKAFVDITIMGLSQQYWIDGITFEVNESSIPKLRLKLNDTMLLNLSHKFIVGTDVVDGDAEIG